MNSGNASYVMQFFVIIPTMSRYFIQKLSKVVTTDQVCKKTVMQICTSCMPSFVLW